MREHEYLGEAALPHKRQVLQIYLQYTYKMYDFHMYRPLVLQK